MTKDEVLKMLSRSGLLFVGYNLKASDLRLFEFSNLVNDHIEEMVNLKLKQAEKREWVGLTDEEKLVASQMWRVMDADGFLITIEAKLKEKNT